LIGGSSYHQITQPSLVARGRPLLSGTGYDALFQFFGVSLVHAAVNSTFRYGYRTVPVNLCPCSPGVFLPVNLCLFSCNGNVPAPLCLFTGPGFRRDACESARSGQSNLAHARAVPITCPPPQAVSHCALYSSVITSHHVLSTPISVSIGGCGCRSEHRSAAQLRSCEGGSCSPKDDLR
jgi:hypothetical protein